MHVSSNTQLKRQAMARKCKLIMSLAPCTLVVDRHTRLGNNTSLDKYIRFDSCQKKCACSKHFLGMTSLSVVVMSSWTGHKGVLLILICDVSHFYLIAIFTCKMIFIWVELWNQFAIWCLLSYLLGVFVQEWPIFPNSNHAQEKFLAYSNTCTKFNINQDKPIMH